MCQTYVLITDTLGSEAKSIRQIMQRTSTHVPRLLHDRADRALAHVEKDKSTPLCHSIKAFGTCRCGHFNVITHCILIILKQTYMYTKDVFLKFVDIYISLHFRRVGSMPEQFFEFLTFPSLSCRNETRCKMRHMVFDSLDGSGCSRRSFQKLPSEGVVKVTNCTFLI